MTSRIGLFGLGLIGRALATRLIAAGHEVVGHDPGAEACAAFAALGGQVAAPGDVWKAKTVLSAVFDTGQLGAVIDAAPLDTGTTLISTSTCDPDLMPELADRAEAKGITLIEAPLSGTSKDLANGTAVFLLGGPEAVCTKLHGVFAALGRAQYYQGPIGQGNRAKLAINLVLGLNRAALAEGLVFAETLGLEPEGFLALLQDSAAASAVMRSKGPLMVARDFRPLGRIAQSAKDFNLIRNAAGKEGQQLPFAETYQRMVDDGVRSGEGDLDNSGILLAIARSGKK